MRMLFEIDKKDYITGESVFSRPSARGIIIKNGKIAMVHSGKFDYYKFPGGGIEGSENKEDALIREVLEETGLCVIRESITEYGQVHRIQKGTKEDIFIQDNFYFICDVGDEVRQQNLDEYEADEEFVLEYVAPQFAADKNRNCTINEFDKVMLERDAKVLDILMLEGYFEKRSDI